MSINGHCIGGMIDVKKAIVIGLMLMLLAVMPWGMALASEKAYLNEDKVFLNVPSYNADVGGSYHMWSTPRSNEGWHGAVVWSVSDEAILRLSDVKDTSCNVRALQEGTATLRATAPNGNYAECVFKVISPIELTERLIQLSLGGTAKIQAQLHPSLGDKVVTWTSSDPDVVSVDEHGVVTGHDFGWAMIYGKVSSREVKCVAYIIPTEREAYQRIGAIKSKYKHGKKWTSANYYMSNANTPIMALGVSGNMDVYMGGGCTAFALLTSDAAFANMPITAVRMTKDNVKDVKIGDIVRLRGGWHYVTVLRPDAKGIRVVEGNWQKKISWNRHLSWDYLKKNGDLIMTRYQMRTMDHY